MSAIAMRLFLLLLVLACPPVLLSACGEPIEPPKAPPSATERTLPVVGSPRVYKVGEAFRVSIVMTEASGGITSRQEYVDVVTAVNDGRLAKWERHIRGEAAFHLMSNDTARPDFGMFEALLPRRDGEVHEAWRAEGVFAALQHSTAFSGMPASGGSADCQLESVQVRAGRARAIIRVEFRAETPKGPLELKGRIEHDLKHKLLVLAEFDGTVGGEKITIRATRALTNFVPPTKSAAKTD